MKDGKLFGKINIIDLLVVLIALFAVVMVALKMTGHLGGLSEKAGTDVVYTVKMELVEPEVYDQVLAFVNNAKERGNEGDQLMANGVLLNGYVTDVTAVPHQEITINGFNGGFSVISGRDTLDLTFTITAYGVDNITTKIGTQEVRVGKRHIVKTTHFEFDAGTIITCEWANGTAAD